MRDVADVWLTVWLTVVHTAEARLSGVIVLDGLADSQADALADSRLGADGSKRLDCLAYASTVR